MRFGAKPRFDFICTFCIVPIYEMVFCTVRKSRAVIYALVIEKGNDQMMNLESLSEIMMSAERIHFVGIGGISMSSLAAITKERGYRVSGSDRNETLLTDRLSASGIRVVYHHSEENVKGASLVVYTAAVHSDNPEIEGAKKLGIPLCSRADYLGWLMSGYTERIGIAGTHGKSTVTSMISEIFISEGLNPTVVSGAELKDMGGAYRIGNKSFFIFEACEYCDSFLSFVPTAAVITNIEYDHADYFKDMKQLRRSFAQYINYAERAIICSDDPESAALIDELHNEKLITFGIENQAEYTASDITFHNGCAEFYVMKNGEKLCGIKLSVPGKHNILNALAAAATAFSYGLSPEGVSKGLERFQGAARRFEYMGTAANGALVYNDYAHHPSEIRATLGAAKAFGKRIVTVFQPHTYSRTAGLWDGFVTAFADSDLTVFADIYAARETNTYGVNSEQLAGAVKGGIYLSSFEKISDYIKNNCNENDIVLILGAGDIIRVGNMILK